MSILLTTKTQQIPGPTVDINCPHCAASSVASASHEQVDRLGLFYIIPLFGLRNTFIRCGACGKQLTSKLRIDEIANYSADDLSHFLAGRVLLVNVFLAVASVLLFWAPIVGLILGVIAVLLNRRAAPWLRTLSWVGMSLSAVITVAVVILLIMGPM